MSSVGRPSIAMSHLAQLLSGLYARFFRPTHPILMLDEPEMREVEFITRDDTDCLCPVTRQVLTPGSKVYQCQQCHMVYSTEGWAFLCEADKGRCCGCSSQKTVLVTILGKMKQEE
jgi:hypothetical protein